MYPAPAWRTYAATAAAPRRASPLPAFRGSPFDPPPYTPFARHSVVPARFRNPGSLRALLDAFPADRPQRRFAVRRLALGLNRLFRIGLR
jgi:hypothetical protein